MATPRNARPGMLLDPAAPINKGRLNWWPMWEGAGGKVLDICGGALGTLTNGAKWAGRGIYLDGTDDYIDLNLADVPPPCSVFSEVVLLSRAASGAVLLGNNDFSSFRADQNGSDSVGISVSGVVDGVFTSPGYIVSLGVPTQLLFVMNSATSATLYANGAFAGTQTVSGGFTGWRKFIGKCWTGISDPLKGYVSNVSVWNRALSALEAQQLAVNPNTGLWVPDITRYYIPSAGGPSGTGALNLRPLLVSGAGKVIFKATGAAALSSLNVSASAKERFTATGASTLSAMTVAGTGKERFTASGSANLASMTVAGSGKERFTATGAISLSPMTSSTAGKERLTATGALILSALTVAGTGAHTEAGVTSGGGAISLAPMTVSGVGKVILKGAGTISLTPAGVSAAGKELFKATGAISLAPGTVSATAKERFKGAGVVSLAPFVAAGAGKEIVSGSAAILLRPITVVGAGVGGLTPAQTYAIEIIVTGEAREIIITGDPREIVVN